MNGWEIAFAIYTCGWTLDRFATTVSAACTRQRIAFHIPFRWSLTLRSWNTGGGSSLPIYGTVSTPPSSCEFGSSFADALPTHAENSSRLFLFYLPFRLYGVIHGHSAANDYALSILACESALIFPR